MPLVKKPRVEYDPTVEGTGVGAAAFHRGALSNDSTIRPALGDEYDYFHCFDYKELRKKGTQNDEFTPRIKWSQSYWRTVW